MIKWPNDQMTKSSNDQIIKWSNDQMIKKHCRHFLRQMIAFDVQTHEIQEEEGIIPFSKILLLPNTRTSSRHSIPPSSAESYGSLLIHSHSVCSQISVISSGAWDRRRLLLSEEDRDQQNRDRNLGQETVEECECHQKKGDEDDKGDDDKNIPGCKAPN